jgi:hypothetical protein
MRLFPAGGCKMIQKLVQDHKNEYGLSCFVIDTRSFGHYETDVALVLFIFTSNFQAQMMKTKRKSS